MSDKLVTIATLSFSRANILKNQLESASIECILTAPDLTEPIEGKSIKVRIKEDDYTKAIEIAEQIEEQYGEENIQIPDEEIKINKILVPVEFTEYSVNGCYYALGLAEKYKAELHIFHCFHNPYLETMPYSDNADYGMNYDPYIQEIESSAREELKGLVKKIREETERRKISGVNIDYTLTSGAIDDQLVLIYEEYKPDLVVLGTRGKGKKNNDIMGRVTTKLIESVESPILSIPEETEFDQFNEINVLYATNFDVSDYNAIRKLMGIMSVFKIKLHCVHIDTGDSGPAVYEKMERLKKYFVQRYKNINVEFDIMRHEDILGGIQNFINENFINIISLSSHKRNIFVRLFYPSITKKIFFHTNLPLLTFPT